MDALVDDVVDVGIGGVDEIIVEEMFLDVIVVDVDKGSCIF